jgi:hypothetical protein
MDSAAGATGTGRRHELDLIRAAIVAGLVFFHTACIFRPVEFYVNDQRPSVVLTLLVFFAQLWGMPLMFIVAGGGIFFSLRSRTAGEFVRERLRRLLVPLVVGVVLLVPPQVFLSPQARNPRPDSYWEFLGRFFDVRLRLGFPWIVSEDGADSLFAVAHLWFLFYLLAYSVLLLPLFLHLLRPPGRWLVGRMAACCQRPWQIFLPALPIVVLEAAFGTWGSGGWNDYAYLVFLAYGFVISADRRLGDAIERNWTRALVVGVAALPVLFVIAHYDIGGAGRNLGSDYGPWSVVWRLLKAIAGWAWTAAVLGLARSLARRPPGQTPRLGIDGPGAPTGTGAGLRDRGARYVHEAVLPFYVLHQTPIIVIGFYVVRWQVGVLFKYLTISLTSLLVTVLVYGLCVRRTRVTRTLFGMRPMEAREETTARVAT